MYRGIDKIINIIYPKTCVLCGKTIKYSDFLCKKCENELEYIEEPFCKKCGKGIDNEETEYCGDCMKNKHYFDMGIGVFAYNEKVRKSIYDFKYKNMKEYAKFYGNHMFLRAEPYLKIWNADVIMPVPVSNKKMIKRGYNQAELIAKEFSKKAGIPLDLVSLYRKKDTKPQKEMSKQERKKNVEKAFIIRGNVVKYKVIILIDDIYTTGSTMDECARCLKMAGAKKVYCLNLSIGAGI